MAKYNDKEISDARKAGLTDKANQMTKENYDTILAEGGTDWQKEQSGANAKAELARITNEDFVKKKKADPKV